MPLPPHSACFLPIRCPNAWLIRKLAVAGQVTEAGGRRRPLGCVDHHHVAQHARKPASPSPSHSDEAVLVLARYTFTFGLGLRHQKEPDVAVTGPAVGSLSTPAMSPATELTFSLAELPTATA